MSDAGQQAAAGALLRSGGLHAPAVTQPTGQGAREAKGDRGDARVDNSAHDRVEDRAMASPWLSVIVPALNEEANIAAAIRAAKQAAGVQVIVVDGGSTDRTREIAAEQGATVLQTTAGRGTQMNHGATAAGADWLLFLHADTLLPADYAADVRAVLSDSANAAGAFRMTFDRASWSLRLIAWGTRLRSEKLALPYGDQALYMRRYTFQAVGGFPTHRRMEDYTLVVRLRRKGKIRVVTTPVVTSARTFTTQGPWRTVLHHQWMILRWYLRGGR